MNESPIEQIDAITEFAELHAFVDDKQLDRALEAIINIMAKPDIPATNAAKLIVELQALSTKFAILATYYTAFDKGTVGSEQYKKKQIYFTLKEALNKLVDSLKYLTKNGAQY